GYQQNLGGSPAEWMQCRPVKAYLCPSRRAPHTDQAIPGKSDFCVGFPSSFSASILRFDRSDQWPPQDGGPSTDPNQGAGILPLSLYATTPTTTSNPRPMEHLKTMLGAFTGFGPCAPAAQHRTLTMVSNQDGTANTIMLAHKAMRPSDYNAFDLE